MQTATAQHNTPAIVPRAEVSATLNLMTPAGLETAMKFAATLVKSGLLPEAINTPEKALVIMLTGQELGIAHMRALRGMNVIKGKVSMGYELMIEHFRNRGGRVTWHERSATAARATFVTPGGEEIPGEFTIAMAQTAGYTSNAKYKTEPEVMLVARCATRTLRAIGEAQGVYDPDELEDMGGAASQPKTVTERVSTNVRSIVRPAKASTTPAAESSVVRDPNADAVDADFTDADGRAASGPQGAADDTGEPSQDAGDTLAAVKGDLDKLTAELATYGPGTLKMWLARTKPNGLKTPVEMNACASLDTLIAVRDELAAYAEQLRGGAK